MKPFNLYVILGFILLVIGIIFDFGFVRTADNFMQYKEMDSIGYTWKMQVYNLIRFYLIILGLLNIIFALFIRKANEEGKLAWVIFWLLEFGCLLLVVGSIWRAHIAPSISYTVALAYYLEFAGLGAIFVSIGFEVFQILSCNIIKEH